MKTGCRYPLAWLFLLGVVILAGCATQRAAPGAGGVAWEVGPLVDGAGANRSLSLDSPAMVGLVEDRPWRGGGTPGYVDRLERGPSVSAGVRGPVYDRSVTRTRNRFESRRGRVNDDFDQHTRRERVIEVVR
ncbi:MAG: hypothetical protein AAGG38_14425 [Planctomycetota bacterium]